MIDSTWKDTDTMTMETINNSNNRFMWIEYYKYLLYNFELFYPTSRYNDYGYDYNNRNDYDYNYDYNYDYGNDYGNDYDYDYDYENKKKKKYKNNK